MKYILTLLLGLVLGAVLVYAFVVVRPRVQPAPGTVVEAPVVGGQPAATALLTLDERFFNTLLGTLLRDLSAPAFPLQLAAQSGDVPHKNSIDFQVVKTQGGCPNQVVINAEGSGVRTGVRIADGKLSAPLAFTGSYNTFGNCLNFRGWAQTGIQFSFDQARQTLYGQINVEGVNLEGTPPVVGGLVTLLVQQAINGRINPLQVLNAQQLALSVPVQNSGTLKAQAKDVRAEIDGNALRLHITYDFSAVRNQSSPGSSLPQS